MNDEIKQVLDEQCQNKAWCVRHGEYDIDDVFQSCPHCKEVADKWLCQECEEHQATVNFRPSVMDDVYGRLCRCCYANIVEKTYFESKENYERLKHELQFKPCV